MAELRPTTARRERAFKLVSVLIGLTIACVIAEVALRLRAALSNRDPAAELQRTLTAYPPPVIGDCSRSAQASLGQLVRPSAERDVVYELKPGLDACYVEARVQTNGQGLRAPRDVPAPKPAGTYRVLLLGDSQTFGQGIAYEETWGAILEAELRSRYDRPIEVLNAGVPGYNTAQEAAVFRSKGIRFEPDCAIVLFIQNDFGVPYLMLEKSPVLRPTSYLFTAIQDATRQRKGSRPQPWLTTEGPLATRVPEAELERIPEAYRHMVGVSGYRRALESLGETSRKAGVPVVDFADYEGLDPAVVAEVGRLHAAAGIAQPEFHYPGKRKFWRSEADPHFNAEGHRNLALRVFKGLQEVGACLPDGTPGARR